MNVSSRQKHFYINITEHSYIIDIASLFTIFFTSSFSTLYFVL